MAPLPNRRPKQLSLGPLEREILEILWDLGTTTAKTIHDRILSDPDRELAYTSVTTVLKRLQNKGWVVCDRRQKVYQWQARTSKAQAQMLWSHAQMEAFLAVSNPDIVAAFADSLDTTSMDKLDAIAAKLKAIRQAREDT
ncbi:MAG: CopY family transcriptional regulator [Spirulina sp. SIO3F2]|nr:CopY family transcriptional regulator [Spirulina sp. SIO3F2]